MLDTIDLSCDEEEEAFCIEYGHQMERKLESYTTKVICMIGKM